MNWLIRLQIWLIRLEIAFTFATLVVTFPVFYLGFPATIWMGMFAFSAILLILICIIDLNF